VRAQRAKHKAQSVSKPCGVCLRRLAPQSLTIVHDDVGDHELCAPCEEIWSQNLMRYFARDFMAYCQASAYRRAA
jgi:hypothetical protein